MLGQVFIPSIIHRCDLIICQNPGEFTLQGTNTYLIGEELPYILLDTGDGIDEYIPLLESVIRDATATAQRTTPRGVNPLVSDIIISHRHDDHHAGLAAVLSLLYTLSSEMAEKKGSLPTDIRERDPYYPPRIHKLPSTVSRRKIPLFSAEAEGTTFGSTLQVISSQLSPMIFGHVPRDDSDTTIVAETPPLLQPLVHELVDNQILTTQSPIAPIQLKVLHTPGHTTDSISILLPSERAMFTADTVLGEGTAVFEDLAAYMNSLGRMLAEGRQLLSANKADNYNISAEGKMRIYPGHGPVIEDGLQKLETYISHRAHREAQILSLLPIATIPQSETQVSSSDKNSTTTTSNLNPATIGSIVRTIYAEYSPTVWPAAERVAWLHLEKLESEGEVVRISSSQAAAVASAPPQDAFRNTSWARIVE